MSGEMQGDLFATSQGGLGGLGADSSLQDTDWIPAVVGVPMACPSRPGLCAGMVWADVVLFHVRFVGYGLPGGRGVLQLYCGISQGWTTIKPLTTNMGEATVRSMGEATVQCVGVILKRAGINSY